MANFKRRRAKAQRGGCLQCKPHKLPANKHTDRQRRRQDAFAVERRAY